MELLQGQEGCEGVEGSARAALAGQARGFLLWAARCCRSQLAAVCASLLSNGWPDRQGMQCRGATLCPISPLQATAEPPSSAGKSRCRSAVASGTQSTTARWAGRQGRGRLPVAVAPAAALDCSWRHLHRSSAARRHAACPAVCFPCSTSPLHPRLQGRVVTAEFDQFFLVNCYVPNRWAQGDQTARQVLPGGGHRYAPAVRVAPGTSRHSLCPCPPPATAVRG